MSIQSIVEILTSNGIEPREAVVEVKMLIEHFCNYNTADIIMGRPLNYEKLKIVEQKAKLRAETKLPIQYIIGEAYFMGNYYKVTPDVLIPRDETELVVRRAMDIIKTNNINKVLDIGVGSGCISCSLAKDGVEVVGIDISQEAIEIAKYNADRLRKKITFIKSDLFDDIPDGLKFDLIISNPPYIPVGTSVQEEVMKEPKTSLFSPDKEGIYFYRQIILNSKKYLNPNGFIVFELGINQSEIVKDIFISEGFTDILIEKDFAGIDRIISAHI